jgi:muramoyltetrapeptide carboxypeptidase LdcA involved in peptidoglycan recycling
MLRNMGERGLLAQFPAVVVGRPKASSRESPRTPEQRNAYRSEQREAVLQALEAYNPGALAVFGIDFGHTDPQWIIPYGGTMRIDGPGRTIHVRY